MNNENNTIHRIDVDLICNFFLKFISSKALSFTDFVSFLYDSTLQDPAISVNFVLKMKVYRSIYDMALIRNEQNNAICIYNVISKNILQWDDGIFQYWFGDKDSYLRALQEFELNRAYLQDNLKKILEDPKLSKLPNNIFY